MLRLLLDIPNLSPWAVLKRMCLILSNDVKTNLGPHQPSSVFACESTTDSFVFTEKSERMPIANTINIVVTYLRQNIVLHTCSMLMLLDNYWLGIESSPLFVMSIRRCFRRWLIQIDVTTSSTICEFFELLLACCFHRPLTFPVVSAIVPLHFFLQVIVIGDSMPKYVFVYKQLRRIVR